MAIDLDITRFFKPVNSVVTGTDIKNADDNVTPFTYTEWLDRVNLATNQTKENYTQQYNNYLRTWREVFDQLKQSRKIHVVQKYKNMLKNVAVNFTTDEQKRFLSNLDYNNPRHVESALSLFSQKLKEIALYYASERQNIKQQRNISGNTGTVESFERYVKNVVPKLAQQKDIVTGDLRSAKTIVGGDDFRLIVKVVELYDVGESNPKTGTIDYNPELFLNFEEAVRQLLVECTPILNLTADGSVSLVASNIAINDQSVSLLDYSNFESYIKDENDLNINNVREYIPKLLGSDLMYLSGGEIHPMVEATHSWRNMFNRFQPTINNTKDVIYRTKAQIGDLYIPSNLGVLTYYSGNPILTITDDNYTGPVPDPNKYGPSPYTGSVNIPISLQGDVTWIKADLSNDKLAGDIVVPKHTPKFYSYRSDEEIKNYARYGVSRWQDATGFFTGPGNTQWANPDVFPTRAHNIFNIDERQQTLMVTDDTATEWSTDLYGNEYVTVKRIKSTRAPLEYGFGEGEDEEEPETRCITIDGGELEPRLDWFEVGDAPYNIYDGGRHPEIDPKIEQAPRLLTFPDLRVMKKYRNPDGTFYEQLEPHNSYYYGPDSTGTEMSLQQITYKGFSPAPFFDFQAYCGLFTDEACGVQDPAALDCEVFDGYAFGTYSDGVSSEGDMTLSIDRDIVDLLAGDNITVNGTKATYTREFDDHASYYETNNTTTTLQTSAHMLTRVYDKISDDATTSKFTNNAVPLNTAGQTGSVYLETVNTGRGTEITITGTGTRTVSELVASHNSVSEVKIDTSKTQGGDLYVAQDYEMKLTGGTYIITTGNTELSLEDATGTTVTFTSDVGNLSSVVTRNSSTSYTYGIQDVNDLEQMAVVLSNVVNTAKQNNDLNIAAGTFMIDGYVDGLRLTQTIAGPAGNTYALGTIFTGMDAVLKSVDQTTSLEYIRDEFGYLTGPITTVSYVDSVDGQLFKNGSTTDITTTRRVELLAEKSGIMGNNIEIVGDGVSTLHELATNWNNSTDNKVKVIQGATEIIQNGKSLKLTGGTNTHSFDFRAGSIQEAYTQHLNRGFDYYDNDVGFSRFGQPEGYDYIIGPVVDGDDFLSGVCAEVDAEFVYQVDTTIPLYEDVLPVAQTQYYEYTQQEADIEELSLYKQNSSPIGSTVFRSYNSGKIEYLSDTIAKLIDDFSLFEGGDFDEFKKEFVEGKVISSQVFVDVLYVETESYIFIMKLNFDPIESQFNSSTAPIITIKTKDFTHPTIASSFRPLYNEKTNTLLVGFTRGFDHDNNVYAIPKIFSVDLNTMYFYQLFPNNDFPEGEKDFHLTDDLQGFSVSSVDRPILSYNDVIDMYTLSFTCMLRNHDDDNEAMVCHGVCISDFEFRAYNMRLTDTYMYHTDAVKKFINPTSVWKPATYEKTIRLWPDDELIPFDHDTNYTMSLSTMETQVLSAYELSLTLDTKTIPASGGAGYRVNRMLFDPGDGSPVEVIDRVIASGLEALDFDVSELPDQGDLYDPRRLGFTHKYRFSDYTDSVTTASVTAVYNNFKKLIYNINIETTPFTIESGFGDVKLVDTRVYMTDDSKCKQILLLETQNPRYLSHVVIDRDKYTNANVVGYVDGERYAGPWHSMSNGVLMTGAEHSPASKVISLTRDESLNATTQLVNTVPTLFNNTDPTYLGTDQSTSYSTGY